jgi:hypothetical protein
MELRIVIASSLGILVMMPCCSNAFWDHAWKKEILPYEQGAGALSHSVAIDALDRPHIVYAARSRSGELSLRHMMRQGESWITNVVDTDCGESAVRITVSASGNLHVCYQGRDVLSQQVVLMYAIHDADQWTTHVVDSGGSGCSIALDPDGHPYISHIEGNGELKLVRYDGAQWTSEDVIAGANPVEPTSMAIAPSGEVHIAFVSATDPPAIYWVQDGSGSWVSSIVDNGRQIGLVLDRTGAPRIVYKPDKGISVIYGQFDGLQWTKFSILQHTHMVYADQLSQHPATAIDSKDAVHIAYGYKWDFSGWPGSGWTGELHYAKYDGITWETSNSIQVSFDVFSFASCIALDSFGFPSVSYNVANSSSALRFAYFVTPELNGVWSRFSVKNKNGLYSFKGSLKVMNSGEGYAGTVPVNFYLSDDMNLSTEDVPVGQGRKIAKLKAGKRKSVRFSWESTQNSTGKYILAVIDPEGLNLERSKTDNVVAQLIP